MDSINFIGESLVPGQIGQLFIVLAFVGSLLSTIAYFFAVKNKNELDTSWTKIGRAGFLVSLISIIGIGVIFLYQEMVNHFHHGC